MLEVGFLCWRILKQFSRITHRLPWGGKNIFLFSFFQNKCYLINWIFVILQHFFHCFFLLQVPLNHLFFFGGETLIFFFNFPSICSMPVHSQKWLRQIRSWRLIEGGDWKKRDDKYDPCRLRCHRNLNKQDDVLQDVIVFYCCTKRLRHT